MKGKSGFAPRLSNNASRLTEAMSIKFNNRVYELRRAGHQIVVLSLGEAFFDLPPVDMRGLPHPEIFHYSHSRGIPELREAIARYYDRNYGLPVAWDNELLVTAGSKAAIYMALACMLDPGDEVLIPEPAWVSYTEQVRLCHGNPVGIPHSVPTTKWERYITQKTKALILNNPHNPTGYRYTEEELARLVALAKHHGLWLLADEAYSDFVPDGRFRSTAYYDKDKTNVAVFNSISKNYGISGWRLGYVIANPELINQVLKVNQHVITCSATILQYYIAAHFHDILAVTLPQIRSLLQKRALVAEEMQRIGLEHLPGDSTFYFFVSIRPSCLGSEDFCMQLLEDHLIAAVPGIGYGTSCDSFVRISIGTEPLSSIKKALVTVKSLIDKTAKARSHA